MVIKAGRIIIPYRSGTANSKRTSVGDTGSAARDMKIAVYGKAFSYGDHKITTGYGDTSAEITGDIILTKLDLVGGIRKLCVTVYIPCSALCLFDQFIGNREYLLLHLSNILLIAHILVYTAHRLGVRGVIFGVMG